MVAFLLLILAISQVKKLSAVYVEGNNITILRENCWSSWSPCTVTCISSPKYSTKYDADFAQRWRIWLRKTKQCREIPPPKQLTQFKKCGPSVPRCLPLESIFKPTPRTVYRLAAIMMCILISVIPSLYICSKYSSGPPMVYWVKNDKVSPPVDMIDAVVVTQHNEDVSSASKT